MIVTIITGSVREGRQSLKVAYYLKKRLEEKAIEVDLIDLKENPLPIFGAPPEQARHYNNNIKDIRVSLQKADALLFVTPEYHGSFSGVLKNALDFFWVEFQKKPIGVATASAGRMGGINASTQLQHVILSLGAYPLPLKFLVPNIQNAFDDSLNPLTGSIADSANKFIDEFLWFAEALEEKKKEKLNVA